MTAAFEPVPLNPAIDYRWFHSPSLTLSGGPSRVVSDEPSLDLPRRPLGFAPRGRHRLLVPVDSPSLVP